MNIQYEQLHSKSKQLEEKITLLNSQLKDLPDGKLICSRNGSRFKWYHSDGHNITYIPKKKKLFAEKLALKKYISLRSKDLTQEKMAIDSYLKYHRELSEQASQALLRTPGYDTLLAPFFTPVSKELTAWANDSYPHNEKYADQLVFKTSSGNLVRSKSEAIIDMLLHVHKIPFRYECALDLDQITIFPDFTIRHPDNGAYFYWEHFGMMDDSNYCHHAYSKMELYSSHGIYPTINLITTFETQKNPLNPDTVQKIIEHYFL